MKFWNKSEPNTHARGAYCILTYHTNYIVLPFQNLFLRLLFVSFVEFSLIVFICLKTLFFNVGCDDLETLDWFIDPLKKWELTLFETGVLRPPIWPPNDPKFREFFYFYMTYLKSKKIFFGFSQWFWVFRRGGGEPPPPPLNVYFQPRPK